MAQWMKSSIFGVQPNHRRKNIDRKNKKRKKGIFDKET